MTADLSHAAIQPTVLRQESTENFAAQQTRLEICNPRLLLHCLLRPVTAKLFLIGRYDMQHPAAYQDN